MKGVISTLVFLLSFTSVWSQTKTIVFEVPEGHAVVGISQDDAKPILIGGPVRASVKCICEEGDGCHPWIVRDDNNVEEGCLLFGCKRCTKEIIVFQAEGKEVILKNATIINLRAGVKIVGDINEIPKQPITGPMLELDTVINSIKQLYGGISWIPDSMLRNWINNDNLAWGKIVINVFGKWAVISYPLGFLDSPYIAIKEGGGGNCVCRCDNPGSTGCSGECSCKWIPFVGTVCWCEAYGCPSCGLSMEKLEYVDPSQTKTKIEVLNVKHLGNGKYNITLQITSNISGTATLAVTDLTLQPEGWRYLHRESITLRKNNPIKKDLIVSIPDNTNIITIGISDGVGKIYSTRIVHLPK